MSEDCQNCGSAMFDLDEDQLCPACSGKESMEDEEAANHKFYLWATNEHHARLLRAIRADLKDILSEEVLNRTKVQALFDCLAT